MTYHEPSQVGINYRIALKFDKRFGIGTADDPVPVLIDQIILNRNLDASIFGGIEI